MADRALRVESSCREDAAMVEQKTGLQPSGAGMTLRGAVFLGIGAMVGAGIFALLGEAGEIAGAAVWVSFVIAGLISLTLGYGMARLGMHYPSSGGLITYLIQGFGNGRLVGIAAWLGYVTAIVVVGAMVAVSFGDYATAIFTGSDPGSAWTKVFASALLVLGAVLCVVGPRAVDRVQSLIVIGLLVVFAVFIAATLANLNRDLLAPSQYPPASDILSAATLTFFAYLGFAVISFAAGDLTRPQRDLPRAMYLALGATMLLYITISLGVFGTLTASEVVEYGPTAIAEAARPTLGDAGFAVMAVAALLATASSVTATLYASPGLTGALAEAGQFPTVFGAGSRLGRHGGLIITTVLTLLFVNVFDLGALAAIGSAVSLAVFLLVGVAALRLRRTIGAHAWILVISLIGSAVVLAFFAVDTFRNDRPAFWTMIALPFVAAAIDAAWKRRRPAPAATATASR
jgi:amino acid transporter